MERPSELTYALNERPPWTHLIGLGLQHVAVMCPYFVMVALVAGAARLTHEAAQSAIGFAMIAVALMTILQSLRLGPVGSGYLCPPSSRRSICRRVSPSPHRSASPASAG
jgi:NCS2 family nucleobase:cation symporter-2